MVGVAVEALRLAQTELLVLACGGGALAAIDLNTGGLVRAQLDDVEHIAPYDVATTQLGDVADPDPAHPDAITLAGPLEVTGRIRARKAERYVRPLLHPIDKPLLGMIGAAVPYWTLCGDRPSIAVVDPGTQIELIRHGRGLHCFFQWNGAVIDLPVVDRRVSLSMAKRGQQALSLRRRFVVALTPPHEGNCYKVVAGLLPRT
jgi:hypothetical protein